MSDDLLVGMIVGVALSALSYIVMMAIFPDKKVVKKKPDKKTITVTEVFDK